jgi:hypothetical protein
MAGEIIKRGGGLPLPRESRQAIIQSAADAHVEQADMRAIATVGEAAMQEVMYLRRIQRELEQAVLEASDVLNLISNSASMAIARRVARFGSERP